MTKQYNYDVFISYSVKDKNIADAICQILEQNKIRCWIAPRDIIPGMLWHQAIAQTIPQSQVLVFIFSSNSNNSKQVGQEIALAANHGIPIIPFRIEDVKPADTIEYFLITHHWLDALTQPVEEHIHRLAKTVRFYLDINSQKQTHAGTFKPIENPIPVNNPSPVLENKNVPEDFKNTVTASNESLKGAIKYSEEIEVGSYILFGRYCGQPIKWRVINKDINGIMLFSERILCLKAFDCNYKLSGETKDVKRTNYGSNCWETSCMREWLNSSQKTVDYSFGHPVKTGVWNGYNAYDTEPGFLSNFTSHENSCIKQAKCKSILARTDSTKKDSGTSAYDFHHDISIAKVDYNMVFYKNTLDRVFLLSVSELREYVYEKRWEYNSKPTEPAVSCSEYKSNFLDPAKNWWYWLRDSYPTTSNVVQCICETNRVGIYSAYYGSIGVRPALYLLPGVEVMEGTGAEDKPYVI